MLLDGTKESFEWMSNIENEQNPTCNYNLKTYRKQKEFSYINASI